MGEELKLEKLKAVKVLGKGAMGTVFLVEHKSSYVALKVVEKSKSRRARWEMNLLSGFSHPFLPSLLGSFESNNLMGWAVPYCPGGDLNVLRYRQTDHVFSPAVIRFYVAEILCALHHLHSMGIAYRDLKPENVLIQQSGHVTLTDFDLSRTFKSNQLHSSLQVQAQAKPKPKPARVNPGSPSFERSNSFVGTEEYIAPEVVRGEGHEFAVDWWALGILTYEMLYGRTPFKGRNRKETFRNVVFKAPEFVGRKTALTDLIMRLLEKDPTKRLGYVGGAAEIKGHHFFRGLKWDLLTEVLRPPFLPSPDHVTTSQLDITGYFHFHTFKSPPSPLRNTLSLPEF
ncbi:hypothetical protein VNO78_14301 [Psophocarpus tetragonolobus]|uniref:non-specific serine/threonine protein kinase n=1 Tax=Psophocarpus tetragonolobus TaxID=3891 RepID=A0AAN9SQ28_PSOTE